MPTVTQVSPRGGLRTWAQTPSHHVYPVLYDGSNLSLLKCINKTPLCSAWVLSPSGSCLFHVHGEPPTTTSFLPPSASTAKPSPFPAPSPEAAGYFPWKDFLIWPGPAPLSPLGAAPPPSALPQHVPRDSGVCTQLLWSPHSSTLHPSS